MESQGQGLVLLWNFIQTANEWEVIFYCLSKYSPKYKFDPKYKSELLKTRKYEYMNILYFDILYCSILYHKKVQLSRAVLILNLVQGWKES